MTSILSPGLLEGRTSKRAQRPIYFDAVLNVHAKSVENTGGLGERLTALNRWQEELFDFSTIGSKELVEDLCNFINTRFSDEKQTTQGSNPLKGTKATFPSSKRHRRGGGATKQPLELLEKTIEHPDDLIEEHRQQGRIELGEAAATHVDRLYPGIKGERCSGLCEVDPLFSALDLDATPANYVASIHNLYLDLRTSLWLHRDDLVSGLRLVLLGRDDVFLSPINLEFRDGENGPFSGIECYDWRQRRFHIVLFIHNRNHFAVIIGDREKGKVLYYNIIPFLDETFGNVRNRYDKFLAAIGAP